MNRSPTYVQCWNKLLASILFDNQRDYFLHSDILIVYYDLALALLVLIIRLFINDIPFFVLLTRFTCFKVSVLVIEFDMNALFHQLGFCRQTNKLKKFKSLLEGPGSSVPQIAVLSS